MTKAFLFFTVILLSLVVIQDVKAQIPFNFKERKIINQLGTDTTVKATYNITGTTGTGSVASHGLGVYLPKNAVIVRSWYYVVTATSGVANSTVAFQCEDANNIKTATDMTAYTANQIVEGAQTGAASLFTSAIGAACQITAAVATQAMSSGKIDLFVEYVVHSAP